MKAKLANVMKGLAIAACSFIGAASAHAGFSTIGNRPLTEVGQEGILEHQYGGNWTKVGDDFYNGTMSAKRMDGFLSVPDVLDIATGQCGYSTDQLWCGDEFTVSAVAKFSGNSQRLAIVDSGGTHQLLNVTGYGFDIDPASVEADMDGETFKWQRAGDSGVNSSLVIDNSDLRDHLVTYVIEGLPGVEGPVWMLFFEDMLRTSTTPLKRTWADYNDLAVEVRQAVHPIPLPPAGWAGLLTLAGAAVVRGRKRISSALMA